MENKVAPIITKYWVEDDFPFELLPAVKELGIGGVGLKGYGCAGGRLALLGFVQMELARVDPSFATSSACMSVWQWVRSTSTGRKNRSKSGCRRWRASKRSAVL